MKNLLVATDLATRSDRAIARAVTLATQTPSRVTIMHVVPDGADAQRHAADAKANIAAQLAVLPVGSTPTAVKILTGKHVDAILAAAKDEAADLVIIGKHRAVENLDVFRGSTAERMARFGTKSVLLVKTETTDRPYDKIVVAVDFSPSSRRAVEFTLGMFDKAEIILAHAYAPPTVPGDINARLDAQFAEFLAGLDTTRLSQLSRQGPPVPTLLKAIAAIGPDLVVTGTHGRTGGGAMQIGTVAERLLSETNADVLAVRG
jgi:universal stress protein E